MILNGVIFKSFFVQRKSNFIKDLMALIPDNTRLLVLCQWSVAKFVPLPLSAWESGVGISASTIVFLQEDNNFSCLYEIE